MPDFTITKRNGETISFASHLSDDAAIAALAAIPGSFAASLYRQAGSRGLSPTQLAWAHKLAQDATAPAPAADASMVALFAPFDRARANGRKRLAMRTPAVTLKLSQDGSALWVTHSTETEPGEYGAKARYLGKVTRNGVTTCKGETVDNLRLIASDPLSAAVAYGRETGCCSICARTLTDPVSVERGIGPICAEKFGL